jgi:DNA-binding NarL/FixJ family response regulator
MEPLPPIRILLVEDHYVVRMGLMAIFQFEPRFQVVGEASNAVEALSLFEQHHPDVTLMDLRMPGMSGLECLIELRRLQPQARVLVLTTYDGDEDVHKALEAGASGYLLKSGPRSELIEAIHHVFEGKRYISNAAAKKLAERVGLAVLSDREMEVLELVTKGFKNKEIATMLNVTEHTAKAHVKNILEKLEVQDRTEAISVALQRGIIHIN